MQAANTSPSPSPLPIAEHLDSIIESFKNSPRVLVEAEPGAGKSTLVPVKLLQNCERLGIQGQIILLQPRRLATKSLANRLAFLLGEKVGESVGYIVRGESKLSAASKLLVMTQGIFVKKILSDPELSGVGLVLIDEFHERHIDGDLSLAMILDTQEIIRPELKLGILSATLNRSALLRLLNNDDFHCEDCFSEGRQYPVDVKHIDVDLNDLKKRHVMVEKSVQYSLLALNQLENGHVLCFLPGVGEIHQASELCLQKIKDSLHDRIEVLELHSQLSLNQQSTVLSESEPGAQRIIFATNIAESSLTIQGVRAVVDTGLQKVARWNPVCDTHSLELELCAQDSCVQRRGRAGRTSPGIAYALWPKRVDAWRPKHAEASLIYEDLVEMKYLWQIWGESECYENRFSDLPPEGHWKAATEILKLSGVINDAGNLSGESASDGFRLNINPRLLGLFFNKQLDEPTNSAKIDTPQLTNIRWYLTALMDENIWPQSQDPISLNNLFLDRFQPKDFSKRITQWEKQFKHKWSMPKYDGELVKDILIQGLRARISWKQGSQNLQFNGAGLELHPQLPEGFISLYQRGSNLKCFIYQEITKNEIEHLSVEKTQLIYTDKWQAQKTTLMGPIVLTNKPCPLPTGEDFQAALDGLIIDMSMRADKKDKQQLWLHDFWNLFEVSDADHRFNERYFWFFQSKISPEKHWRKSWNEWLTPYLSSVQSFKDMKSLKLRELWNQSLDYETQSEFKRSIIKTWQAPSGQKFDVDYSQKTPKVSCRLQDVLGLEDHPMILNKPILLELLSPARRPIQTTQDIRGFWAGSYSEVRKEMKGRYPRHNWPEDPTKINI